MAPPERGPEMPRLAEWQVGALHVTGAPQVDPADRGAAIDPYAAVVSTRVVDISADATELLVLQSGDARIVRGPLETPVARTIDVDVSWAALGDAGEIVYAADRDGTEDDRLYRRANAAATLVADRRVADPIALRGHVVWAEPDGVSTALWMMALSRGAPRRVFAGEGSWTPIDLSPDGTQLLARRTISIETSTLYRIDLRDGHAVALTSVDERVAAPAGAFGAHGELFAIASAGDRLNLWELLPRGARLIAPELAWDVTELAVSHDGATVAFTTDEDGVSVLRLYDVATHTHRIATAAPTGGVIGELRFAADVPVLAFSFTDARHPRATSSPTIFGRRSRGRVEPRRPRRARHLAPRGARARRDRERRRPRGDARDPAAVGGARARVVIELHGGPEDQWLPKWSPFEQFLASRGFAIIQPNVRGSIGYGRAFAALDNGSHRADPIRDVGAVLDWVATQPDLDARHVAVMGTSYGGYLALASLIAFPDRFHAGIDIVGIADFVAFLEGTAAYRRAARRAEYGDERLPDVRAELAKLSPLAHAAAIRAPLLVAQGRHDPRVPPAVADQLVAAVRAAAGSVWYLSAGDEGHGFNKPTNRGALETLIVQLLER